MTNSKVMADRKAGADIHLDKFFATKSAREKELLATQTVKLGKAAIPQLVAALECTDPQKIADICDILVRIGKPVIPAMVAELDNPDQFVQGAAINTLKDIGAASVKPVLRAIATGNQSVLGAGKAVIREIGQDAIPELQKASDPKSSCHSTHSVNLLIELDAQAASTLVCHLKDGLASQDQFMAGSAISTFTSIGKGAVPQLIGFLEDPSQYIQQNAMSAIVNIGEASINDLIVSLGSESQLRQQNAYLALKRIGKSAIPALIEASKDGFGPKAANSRRLLMEMGTDPDKKKRFWQR